MQRWHGGAQPGNLFSESHAHYHRGMDTKLLELLVCPVTKGPLIYLRDRQELLSRSARLAYPVRDGIPILLEHEARTISEEEAERPRPPSPTPAS